MSVDIGNAVHVHPLNVDHHLHNEINTRADQLVIPNSPLCDIAETYYCALGE